MDDVGKDVVPSHVSFFPVVRAQTQCIEDVHEPVVKSSILKQCEVYSVMSDIQTQKHTPKSEERETKVNDGWVLGAQNGTVYSEVHRKEQRHLHEHLYVSVVRFTA